MVADLHQQLRYSTDERSAHGPLNKPLNLQQDEEMFSWRLS